MFISLIPDHKNNMCRYCNVPVGKLQLKRVQFCHCLHTVAHDRQKKLNTFLPFLYIYLFIARYECEESFTTLNVDIRNHQNLLDSLEQYVKGDLLEGANAYHCEKCNKKVIFLIY